VEEVLRDLDVLMEGRRGISRASRRPISYYPYTKRKRGYPVRKWGESSRRSIDQR